MGYSPRSVIFIDIVDGKLTVRMTNSQISGREPGQTRYECTRNASGETGTIDFDGLQAGSLTDLNVDDLFFSEQMADLREVTLLLQIHRSKCPQVDRY